MTSLTLLNFYGESEEKERLRLFKQLVEEHRPQILALQKCYFWAYPTYLKSTDYQIIQPLGQNNLLALSPDISVQEIDHIKIPNQSRRQISCLCRYGQTKFRITYALLKSRRDPAEHQILMAIRRYQLTEIIRQAHRDHQINHLMVGGFNLIRNDLFSAQSWHWNQFKELYDRLFHQEEEITLAEIKQLTSFRVENRNSYLFSLRLGDKK